MELSFIDPWRRERMRTLTDGVLMRGARRFREALQELNGSESEYVMRIRKGLRATETEMQRRGLAGTEHSPAPQPGGDGVRMRAGSVEIGSVAGDAPAPDPHEQQPFWRLIPNLIGTSSKVVSVLSEEGRVCYQSPPVKWLLGFDAEELMGQPLAELLCTSCREQARDALGRMAQDEQTFERWRLEFRTASGGSLWLEGMASNFLRDPRLGGILVYWREYVE